MLADEQNIKRVFEEHISRIGSWPPSWSDVEDVIREAYWAGAQAASSSAGDSSQDDMFSYRDFAEIMNENR